jgi:hypothetical protein
MHAKPKVREAMWSFYFHGQGFVPAVVPRALQPMRLANALEIITPLRDPSALIRAYTVTDQLYKAAGEEDVPSALDGAFLLRNPDLVTLLASEQHAATRFDRRSRPDEKPAARDSKIAERPSRRAKREKDGTPSRKTSSRAKRIPKFDAPPKAAFFDEFVDFLASALPISSNVLAAFFDSVAKMLVRNAPTTPCSKPTCTVTINPFSNETKLTATIQVTHPLATLVPKLDPRAWSNCSDLFTKTYQVDDPPSPSYTRISAPWKAGDPWNGLLFEQATCGQQQIENILRIDFKPPGAPGGAANQLRLTYDLYRSISYSAGALHLPGMMRQNRGYLIARRVNAAASELEVEKIVKYGRLSSWSGSRVIDYGEILNYVARALFAEWVHHIETFVGCCQP